MKKVLINVNEEIYKKYQELCKERNTSVAIELRNYMRAVVERVEKGEQWKDHFHL